MKTSDGVQASRAGELRVERYFTRPDVDPFAEVDWEIRDARIGYGDKVAFEQKGIEFPKVWSQNATNIVAQKYFRGPLGSPRRERSVRDMINRVVGWYSDRGAGDGYLAGDGEASFRAELTHLLLMQKMAFNSPVWFNVGLVNPPRVSACFILDVEDDMHSILNWYVEEGLIFKAGSGAGINLSKLRSSKELLTSGGTASGPVSFMRGADASAGTIKSGGSTRRAAKMVVLDVDHPDVEEFINCKVREERKARALREAGFDMDLDGADSHSLQYQNANNSVGLTDAFLEAYLADKDWDLKAVKDGRVIQTVKARKLMRQIAEAAWECADPGVFYLDTMNAWHTSPAAGPIKATQAFTSLGRRKTSRTTRALPVCRPPPCASPIRTCPTPPTPTGSLPPMPRRRSPRLKALWSTRSQIPRPISTDSPIQFCCAVWPVRTCRPNSTQPRPTTIPTSPSITSTPSRSMMRSSSCPAGPTPWSSPPPLGPRSDAASRSRRPCRRSSPKRRVPP